MWQREMRKKGTYEHIPNISNFNTANADSPRNPLEREKSMRSSLVKGMKQLRNSITRKRRSSATSAASAADHNAMAAARKKNDDYQPPQLNPMAPADGNAASGASEGGTGSDGRVFSMEGVNFTDTPNRSSVEGAAGGRPSGQRRQRLFNS